jgi:hypothetical protein
MLSAPVGVGTGGSREIGFITSSAMTYVAQIDRLVIALSLSWHYGALDGFCWGPQLIVRQSGPIRRL